MRAKRWSAKVPSIAPLLLLGAAILFAWTIFLRAEDDQSKQELLEAEEREKMLLLSQLQQEQVILRDSLQYVYQSPQQERSEAQQRGIVICAGGNKLLINVFVSVKVLRDTLNCTLPIEIYHNGQEDVGPVTREAFKVFANVTFLDLNVLALPAMHKKPKFYNGYVSKILSLFLTKYDQVLLLDADSQPLVDPASLFELNAFKRHGNTFWPDYWAEGFSESPQAEVYEWLQLEQPWNLTQGWQCAESGQVLIDNHAELLYQHMLGDKDTFEMAFMLAGKHPQFHRVPISPGVPLSKMYKNIHQGSWIERFTKKDETRRYLRVGVIQYSDMGVPAFMHRTERTKFASWRDGYTLDVMRPVFVLPSFGPNISSKALEKPLDAGFSAYQDIERILGPAIKSTLSP